ncbi:MAG: NUDIX hydrolase [Rhodospirillales bacterium]|nr:NUDIX hydrolase [Rhodospirillales bacterium]
MTGKNITGPSVETVPDGDNRTRLVCPDCGYIEYDNPKVIVGTICEWGDKILLCRRAIEPRLGYWTIPAGFMELGETTMEGAARETLEEAGAKVEVSDLVGIYDIARISHVYVIFRARMLTDDFSPGEESQEVALFGLDEIPWPELAFPSITWALERYRDGAFPVVESAPADQAFSL